MTTHKNHNENKQNQAKTKNTAPETHTEPIHSEEMFNFQEQINATEEFLERNRKVFAIGIIALLAFIAIVVFWTNYKNDKDLEAADQMFRAEQYFEADSFVQALNGDGNNPGFLAIIEDYKGTKTANLAYYYAGIAYLKIGEFEKAVEYLNKYDGKDDITEAVALGAIGDAHSEMKHYDEAAKYYQKAADKNLQNFSPVYLMKLGLVYEATNQNDKAIATYKTVKTNYSDSQQARTIDEFISRVQAK